MNVCLRRKLHSTFINHPSKTAKSRAEIPTNFIAQFGDY